MFFLFGMRRCLRELISQCSLENMSSLSFIADLRAKGRRPFSCIKSILRSIASDNILYVFIISSNPKLFPGLNENRISMSLCSVSSFRAKEPKTHAFPILPFFSRTEEIIFLCCAESIVYVVFTAKITNENHNNKPCYYLLLFASLSMKDLDARLRKRREGNPDFVSLFG